MGTDKAGYSSLITQHFEQAIDAEMGMRGYQKVDVNPDLLVNFMANAVEKTDVRSTPSSSVTMGTGYYGYRGGMYASMPIYSSPDVETVRYKVGTANIDIVVGRRTSTYSVSGRVVDADTHEPIGGIQVMYGTAPKDQSYYGGIILPANSKGEFRLEGLEPGRYGVQIAGQFDSSGYYSDPTFFEVVDGDVANLEVKATRGLSLSGVVVADGITNREALATLTAWRITASVPSTSSAIRFPSSGSSPIGADGSFQINGLRAGKASISMYPGGGSVVRRFSITRIERDGVEQPQGIEISASQPVTNLRIFITFGTGTIRGTVTITGGTLPPDARLFVRATRPGPATASNSIPVDSRGRFMISNLAAGTYEVTLQRYPPAQVQPPKRPPPPLKQTVSVADGAETEITFTLDLSPEGGP